MAQTRKEAIIFDIDGTLAHMTGRIERHGKKVAPFQDWDADDDEVDKHVAKFVNILKEHYQIIICSGRKDSSKQVLKDWLKWNNIHYNEIFMRRKDDNRNDADVKEEIYYEYIEPFYDVFCVFDDRDRVVKRWREMGLKVFQVAEGSF